MPWPGTHQRKQIGLDLSNVKKSGDIFSNFCGLLRIYELYHRCHSHKIVRGRGGRDKTLPDIYYPIEGVDKLILFCFCCDETQGKNNLHHFEINQNTKQ